MSRVTELNNPLAQAPLGKATIYPSHYQPDLLFAIPRKTNRKTLGINELALPFSGNDVWNAYEISWLDTKGKPQIAYAQFSFPCESPKIVESKSFKLYLNSLNHTVIDSIDALQSILVRDLSKATEATVSVKLSPHANPLIQQFNGVCLDDLDITCDLYTPHPDYLTTLDEDVSEIIFSNLLKTNCPITGQPDWASIQIAYTGKKIKHENLLKYIVSLRNQDEFAENCVEHIFMDITARCAPEKLCVYTRFMRRGGLDINPYRANHALKADELDNIRLWRQ